MREFNVVFGHNTEFFQGMMVFTMVCAVLGVFGMFILNTCVSRLTSHNPEKVLEEFKLLYESLRFFLTSVSLLILFSVITTAFIQQAIEAIVHVKGFTLFPGEFIYSYGLVFTIFLAIVYIPIYVHLQTKGNELNESLSNAALPEEKLKLLKSKESPLKNLQILFSILAPALGSIFTEAIKHFE